MDEEYLAHHGIKGQKWGVRRYQNKDGSLTPEGKIRYSEQFTTNGFNFQNRDDAKKYAVQMITKNRGLLKELSVTHEAVLDKNKQMYDFLKNTEVVNKYIKDAIRTDPYREWSDFTKPQIVRELSLNGYLLYPFKRYAEDHHIDNEAAHEALRKALIKQLDAEKKIATTVAKTVSNTARPGRFGGMDEPDADQVWNAAYEYAASLSDNVYNNYYNDIYKLYGGNVKHSSLDGLYISHYRTKGSKNGVRLYQYKDGSLTPAGRLRYLKNKVGKKVSEVSKKISAKQKVKKRLAEEKRKESEAREKAKKLLEEEKRAKESARKKEIDKRRADSKITDLSLLSNAEIATRIDRMKLEAEYKRLYSSINPPKTGATKKLKDAFVDLTIKSIDTAATRMLDRKLTQILGEPSGQWKAAHKKQPDKRKDIPNGNTQNQPKNQNPNKDKNKQRN